MIKSQMCTSRKKVVGISRLGTFLWFNFTIVHLVYANPVTCNAPRKQLNAVQRSTAAYEG